MLSNDDNQAATRIGPGTLMGNLMRQYWLPALLSSELPGPDCPPVRTLLLGERLIAFRDSNGQVGLLENHCPHRGASLWFGRNEECGLRCVYHGWKFDVHGNCVDMPNEDVCHSERSEESVPGARMLHSVQHDEGEVKAVAYPCRERNGVIWAYLGPRATPPPLPDVEGNMLPEGSWSVIAIQRECNWLQALEGDIDTSHFSFLHAGALSADDQPAGTFSHYILKDRAPHYEVVDTAYGVMYGAYRPAAPGQNYWRVAQFVFPCLTMPPQGVLGHKVVARWWVPLDDEHTMFYMLGPKPGAARPPAEGATGLALSSQLLPNTTDWHGRFRMAASAANDYEIDRGRQSRKESYTGLRGIHLEDQAITESMGAIYDRSREHLGSSDGMVIRVRRRLLAAARELADRGVTPPAVDQPELYGVRAGGLYLAEGEDWLKATEPLRKGFVEHEGLDLAISGAIV